MDRILRFLEPDDVTLARMEEIGLACFGEQYSKRLLARNWLTSDPRGRFIGLFEADRLVAFNGFLAHPATEAGDPILLFQSCHSATDPAYRGQGLFSRLINDAKAMLDGDYIVGFPNDQSGPIFTRKLGFECVGLKRVWLPTRFAGMLFDADRAFVRLQAPNLCTLDERQAAAWKQKEHPGDVILHESHGNFIWGMVAERAVGPGSLRYLKVGGIEFGNPAGLPPCLRSLGRTFGIEAVQFICTHNSALVAGARIPLGGERTEPLIWFPLRSKRAPPLFDVSNGFKDIW